MYSFAIGDLDCAVVSDGHLMSLPERLFPVARRAEWPPMELNAQGRRPIQLNCLLVRSAGQTVLIDLGRGSKPDAQTSGGGQLVENLASVGVQPSDVDLVVLTHVAWDHIGGATFLREGGLHPTFPRARHIVPKADWDYFTSPERVREGAALANDMVNLRRYIQDSLVPLAERNLLELVEGDASITSHVSLVPTPGHTPGHCTVLVQSNGEMVMHLGDLVHHHVQLEKPDLIRERDSFPEQVLPSRKRVVQLALERSALVLIYHEQYPGLGRLTIENGQVIFHPISR